MQARVGINSNKSPHRVSIATRYLNCTIMEKLDLSSQSRSIQEAYDKVVRGTPGTSYVVYSVNKSSTVEVSATGDGSLDDFVENFTDGQVQFGLARVSVPGSDVFKNLLIGWCPDNAPTKSRLSFASNFAEVARVLSGYHVQITARDQDDLDVDDFMARVRAAAGAGYSGSTGSSSKPVSAPKPVAAKPSVAKPSVAKPSFVPKSTGKPVGAGPSGPKPIVPKPAVAKPAAKQDADDGWGDAKEIEERDFETQPLDSVPSAYKPTKVDINELRKQKSDTISSQPKKSSINESDSGNDATSKPLSERMKSYQANEDGRLSSLPKPKISHSVASRYNPTESKGSAPAFGSKPTFGSPVINKNDKIVGGVSRNFAVEGGKTPAQIWAEKRGQKSVSPDSTKLEDRFAKTSIDDSVEEPQLYKPSAKKEEEEEEEEEPETHEDHEEDEHDEEPPAAPARSLPPAPARNLPPAPARNLPPPPVRNVPVQQEDEPDKEEQAEPEEEPEEPEEQTSLPARNLPPPPQRETAAPSLPSRSQPEPETAPAAAKGATAVAEYDYEKEEDNELGFKEGDLIVEIDFVDTEWWSGKHSKTGEVGLFPATYVKRQDGGAEETGGAENAGGEPETKGATAIAEYKYEKDEDNEIGFDEGDLIVEIEFVDEDWWSGKHSVTGEVGLFPANYVTLKE
ncbi:hypothetical protein PGUG_02391 [Meyerozyma guilliermondii ATCC 6260]|uniref:Actin-binding protein n=1 Tax=Meyerozyma guilliermondii (strain ATCC 6260 / CBS 566 / DSM 6381 / JCM 1539 / NBRC 10279 / NRRL Y-324) TaxID=294746 RepID=A5DGJ0_PICGU|nr:uncharacterized protein PGUG_02391 [Meyerozyma guilliermondii ATCC 6260]EDK38293.2 hypothetical protein PGUG_02391 [Meyerozyma guilliermondii ATCC 6260]